MNVSKKLRKAINLNVYRNLHHYQLNYQKQAFSDEVKKLLKNIPYAEKIWIHYTVNPARNGRLDTMNVGSIADKYFCDTLVEAGKIEDDDKDHIVLSTFSFGAVSSLDGHVTATINILEREVPMRVLLDQEDIQTALDTYVQTMGISGASGVELSVNDDGEVEAEVMLGEAKPKTKTTGKGRGGRPRGSKNKPKENTEGTEDDSNSAEAGSNGTTGGGSESSQESAEEGDEESPKTKAGKSPGKNLFSEEDSPSSESSGKADSSKTDSDAEGETKPDEEGVKKPARNSIFDD